MYACRNGHIEVVKEFLPFLKDIDDFHHAMSWAASRGHAAIVDLILQKPGIDVNSQSLSEPPLFLACRAGELKTIELLLRAGADPTVSCNPSDNYFVSNSTSYGSSVIPSRVHEHQKNRGYTALHALCQGKHIFEVQPECVLRLIQAGADVDR